MVADATADSWFVGGVCLTLSAAVCYQHDHGGCAGFLCVITAPAPVTCAMQLLLLWGSRELLVGR